MAKKKSTTATYKRKLDEITAELPTKEKLSQRLPPLIPSSEPPRLCLPTGLDLREPVRDLHSLYQRRDLRIHQQVYKRIRAARDSEPSDSATTSTAAAAATTTTTPTTPRAWKDTTTAEIKVFFGILIYMGVYPEPRIDLCWQQDRREGPLHSPPLYLTLKRFEQFKRYLHISHPDEDEK